MPDSHRVRGGWRPWAGLVLRIRITGFSIVQPLFEATLSPGELLGQLDDRTLDLGALMGLASFTGEVALTIELRLTTTDPTARVALDLLVANTTLGSGLPIPEPSTSLLLSLGIAGLSARRERAGSPRAAPEHLPWGRGGNARSRPKCRSFRNSTARPPHVGDSLTSTSSDREETKPCLASLPRPCRSGSASCPCS